MFVLLRITGITFLFRELIHRNEVTILCYHDPDIAVAEAHFQALHRDYNIIPLIDYIDWRTGKSNKRPPSKALVVTFDDGHKGNYKFKPVLECYSIPITIFLCSAIIGTNRHYWWTEIGGQESSKDLEKIPNAERLKKLLAMGFEENKEYESRQSLSKNEINELKPLVDFQSHSRFHPVLSQCDEGKLVEEIGKAKIELQEDYDINIYALAYPNGAYSEQVVAVTKECGYQCALTTEFGVNNNNTDIFRLKRIDIPDTCGVSELLVKASGSWAVIPRLSK